jgi:hypothetical protein
MMTFRRKDPLNPDKESTLSLDLMPVLIFALGYVLTRRLAASLGDL